MAIEIEILEAVITEKLLKNFEIIEELDKTEGLAIMESVKVAYCVMTMECMVGGIEKHERYFDALNSTQLLKNLPTSFSFQPCTVFCLEGQFNSSLATYILAHN